MTVSRRHPISTIFVLFQVFEAIDTDNNGELTTGDIIRLEGDSSVSSICILQK